MANSFDNESGIGTALALTFAFLVAKRDWAEERRFDETRRPARLGSGGSFS
jgi:hypothetical protein